MPDRRRHRGAHPEDARLFSPEQIPSLRTAVEEFSWLLTRGYADESALALVGNRHNLRERQRAAVRRAACSDMELRHRESKRMAEAADAVRLGIDGYNLLITVETALSGGAVLLCRDGCYRDLAGLHGTYRKVEETVPALRLIVKAVSRANVETVDCYFDRPVSNSGRLKAMLADILEESGAAWNIELVADPDAILSAYDGVVLTSDSRILDSCGGWTNLARQIVGADIPTAWIVDLPGSGESA